MSVYNNYLIESFVPWHPYEYVLGNEDITDYMRMTLTRSMFISKTGQLKVANPVNQFLARMISQP